MLDYQMKDEILDVRDLQKWNCIIEPSTSQNQKQIGGLYLADIDCAQDAYLLTSLNIGALLSVIDEPKIILPHYMNHMVREVHLKQLTIITIKTISIPDSESQSIIHFLPQCFLFIDNHRQKTNVMVHCFAGISRSASVVIAYLMQKFSWGFQRTLLTVKAVRKQVKPNSGFMGQLYHYEKVLQTKRQQKINQRSSFDQQLNTEIKSKKQKNSYEFNQNIQIQKHQKSNHTSYKELKQINEPSIQNKNPLNKIFRVNKDSAIKLSILPSSLTYYSKLNYSKIQQNIHTNKSEQSNYLSILTNQDIHKSTVDLKLKESRPKTQINLSLTNKQNYKELNSQISFKPYLYKL